ncbi:glycosyltransferase family 4 protein [Sphingomonas sp. HDW15A]|uniref:glycosyltransferase family 4 protein n=1 Tax=Sphingomonas sp. HDW15A TaxID=2714942 RepID=UPI0014096C62|nr:glycosyltransferase family 4 protein [Sphingomonas sp. HDW15A]QIK95844.1 glycosyltransferase family 4 protein [Sphingomonas sp. HDW15A]
MGHVLIVSNCAWNIFHFRKPILDGLLRSGRKVTVSAARDGYETLLVEQGVAFEPLEFSASGKNPFEDALLAVRLRRIIRKAKPDAVLTFTIKPNIYGSLAAALSGTPAYPTVSGLGSAFLSGGILPKITKFLFRIALKGARLVFFQNEDDRELFHREKLVELEKTRLVAGSGIDLDAFKAASLPTSKPFTFLQIGRILADKGVRELVEATRILRAEGKTCRVLLLGEIGSDNPSAIPASEVRKWIDEGLVEHVPPVNDVRPIIAQAHTLILPSYREGLPRSLLEGAAMARPLLASEVPGCRDLVSDGVNGFLCQARSSRSLADAMARMIDLSRDDLVRMGTKSRALAERKYDQSLVTEAYLREMPA